MTTVSKYKNISLGRRSKQKGMAMLVVVVALLVLTLLGLSAADSGSLQSLMVRNSQLRLEAFNSSFAEIEAQLESYGDKAAGAAKVVSVVDGAVLLEGDLGVLSKKTMYEKSLRLEGIGGCPYYYNSINGIKKCSMIQLSSGSTSSEVNIGSNQEQQFAFLSF